MSAAARYRLSNAARTDIVQILAWTHQHFGGLTRKRYEHLLATALRDIASDPLRPGSAGRPELGEGARSWHLRLSGGRARFTVQRPRHFIIYRALAEGGIAVARILHDAMDIPQQMERGGVWEISENT